MGRTSNTVLVDLKEDFLVRKANELSEAIVSVGNEGRRISEAAIGAYNKTGSKSVRFKVSQIYELLEKQRPDVYRNLDSITRLLFSNLIHVPVIGNRGQNIIQSFPMFEYSNYDHEAGEIETVFKEQALPYLLVNGKSKGDDKYNQYLYSEGNKEPDITNKLYEIFSANAYKGSWRVTVEYFRKWALIAEDKHQLYGHLKSRFITPKLKKLKERKAFDVALKEYKEGRKIVEIEFLIDDMRAPLTVLVEESSKQIDLIDNTDAALEEVLLENGFNDKKSAIAFLPTVKKVAEEKGITPRELVDSNVAYMLAQKAKKKTVTGGFLRAAIKGDYAEGTREEVITKKKDSQAEREEQAAKQRYDQINSVIDDITHIRKEKHIQAIYQAIEVLTETELTEVTEDFNSSLPSTVARQSFRKKGWKSPSIVVDLRVFWANKGIPEPDVESIAAEKGIVLSELITEKETLETQYKGLKTA